ncbi:MAG: GlxA family transcriptional regulator [Sneathiella sp.]|nr:GlxA family transcriptional regulator [Sneathiella sp.]
MSLQRRLLFFVYDGFDILATTGPAGVFATANSLCKDNPYETIIISMKGGPVSCNAGFPLLTEKAEDVEVTNRDSLFIAGAANETTLRKSLKDKEALHWMKRVAHRCERFGSVCTGSFLLAAAGLLEGRKAATHWRGSADLAKYYPATHVLADDLYVIDGTLWTSAGVTTGIDMALAMVEKDCGSSLMGEVAKQLVVYAHRPGNQSQFSSVLNAQISSQGRFSDVIVWIEDHLESSLKVADMADQAGMSERSFYRKFVNATGITPSKYLENARLEKAKQLLERNAPIKRVSGEVGFRSEAAFRSAFTSRYGVSPSLHKKMHAGTG